MLAGCAVLFALSGAQAEENRLWFVELELRGPCAEVHLDCGPDGATRVLGPFSSAEDRRLRVPVPARSGLGAKGLSAQPWPRASVHPPSPSASARVLGWTDPQPAERLETLGALLARPRPPAASAPARAARTELFVALLAGGLLFHLHRRRRLLASLALALGSGFLVLVLARGRSPESLPVRVLEWAGGGELALAVQSSFGELALPREWLEVRPAGRPLEFLLGDGRGRVRAPGASLSAVELVGAPRLTRLRNDGEPLAEVWTRDARGAWRARGPWPGGVPLGADTERGGRAPPGWLASGLSPGRAALLARTASGGWLRCLDFALE
jgi:hypothetical protein